ncbi:hypothetical protein CK203_039137 [Vitis vinifera]|uniref:Uncharacterized protein n=1 Tax=Vitis vinifera TaxID=29760 RepID=A0A438IFM0_VITVI|nr:hypothetical protein CK203_039137 [Vitis vinifera]
MLSGSLAKVHKPCYVIPTACHSPCSAALRRIVDRDRPGSRAWIRIGGRLVRGSDPHSQIDGHQAQPLSISGSTPFDSIVPPPPPPPSGPTVQQDYIVLPPPPPQLVTPRAGAFVLHGQTATTPHSVVAPA